MNEELKQRVLNHIVNADIATYGDYVMSISNLMVFEPGFTKYRLRKVLKELLNDGLIKYTSRGCPAVEDYVNGEVLELVCDASPPVNGYVLTDKGHETDAYKTAYQNQDDVFRRWNEDLY
jgi:hypothetical protein